jgi:hypothetical protein
LAVTSRDAAGNVAETIASIKVVAETGTQVGTPYLLPGVQPLVRKAFIVHGTLAPRHSMAQKPIELRISRLKGGMYVYQQSVSAGIDQTGKYKGAVTLLIPGTYRITAMHRWPLKGSGSLQFNVGMGAVSPGAGTPILR